MLNRHGNNATLLISGIMTAVVLLAGCSFNQPVVPASASRPASMEPSLTPDISPASSPSVISGTPWDSGTTLSFGRSSFTGMSGPVIIYNSGNTFALSPDGKLIFHYADQTESTFPFGFITPINSMPFEPAVYISPYRTAVAYADRAGTLTLAVSDDEGATWAYSTSFSPPADSQLPWGPSAFTVGIDGFGYLGAYLGFTSPDDGWLVLYTCPAADTEGHALFITHDGGKNWAWTSAKGTYYGQMTGINFLDASVGFWCFRTDIYPLTVFGSTDGGGSWSMIPLTLPPNHPATNTYPESPYFIAGKGYMAVELNNGPTMGAVIFYTSSDGGTTWKYDPSMDTTLADLAK